MPGSAPTSDRALMCHRGANRVISLARLAGGPPQARYAGCGAQRLHRHRLLAGRELDVSVATDKLRVPRRHKSSRWLHRLIDGLHRQSVLRLGQDRKDSWSVMPAVDAAATAEPRSHQRTEWVGKWISAEVV